MHRSLSINRVSYRYLFSLTDLRQTNLRATDEQHSPYQSVFFSSTICTNLRATDEQHGPYQSVFFSSSTICIETLHYKVNCMQLRRKSCSTWVFDIILHVFIQNLIPNGTSNCIVVDCSADICTRWVVMCARVIEGYTITQLGGSNSEISFWKLESYLLPDIWLLPVKSPI